MADIINNPENINKGYKCEVKHPFILAALINFLPLKN